MMRTCGAVLGRNRDTDAWSMGATRLHAKMMEAARADMPLAVLMLHVERQLAPREKSLLTLTQFDSLVSAINLVLRLNVDFALPLDASEGLVRLLVVLPATGLQEAQAIANRLRTALAESVHGEVEGSHSDESALLPDCAIGFAAIESWDNAGVANAAALVAAAERRMEKLALPSQ